VALYSVLSVKIVQRIYIYILFKIDALEETIIDKVS